MTDDREHRPSTTRAPKAAPRLWIIGRSASGCLRWGCEAVDPFEMAALLKRKAKGKSLDQVKSRMAAQIKKRSSAMRERVDAAPDLSCAAPVFKTALKVRSY